MSIIFVDVVSHWWLVLVSEDEPQTDICSQCTAECAHCTCFCSDEKGPSAGWHSHGQGSSTWISMHSWGYCLFLAQASICAAFEEDAAWLLALREERRRRKQVLAAQRWEAFKLLVWVLEVASLQGRGAAFCPATCTEGFAPILRLWLVFGQAGWKSYKAYLCEMWDAVISLFVNIGVKRLWREPSESAVGAGVAGWGTPHPAAHPLTMYYFFFLPQNWARLNVLHVLPNLIVLP